MIVIQGIAIKYLLQSRLFYRVAFQYFLVKSFFARELGRKLLLNREIDRLSMTERIESVKLADQVEQKTNDLSPQLVFNMSSINIPFCNSINKC